MKKITSKNLVYTIIAVILFLFAISLVCSARVSRRDVTKAKNIYIHHKQLLENGCIYESLKNIKTDKCYYEYYINESTVEIDSLYWQGLSNIRHDQKFWIFKK